MKLITSYFSPAIIRNDIKRLKWLSIIYFIVLIFMYPIDLFVRINRIRETQIISKTYYQNISYIFNNNGTYMILIFTSSILLAVLLSRYLHVEKAINNMHSLPISRTQMYNSHVLSGILLSTIPLIITTLLSVSVLNIMDAYKYLGDFNIIEWAGKSLILTLVIFLLSMFIGIITGQSIAQGIISFLLMFLPIGLGGLVLYNVEMWIFGFGINNDTFNILAKISPGAEVAGMRTIDKWEMWQYIVFIVFSISFYLVGMILNKIRQSEESTNLIAFPIVKSIFKYSVVFSVMMLGGLFFKEIGFINNAGIGVVIVYLVCATLAYIIIEMLYQKSMIIKKSSYKGYFIYLIVFVIGMSAIKFDTFGYVNRVPDVSKIDSVYFSDGYNNFQGNEKIVWLKDPENIKNVRLFHKEILKNEVKDNGINLITFKYKLKNGLTLNRQYKIDKPKYKKFIKSIFENKEYKKSYFSIFKIDENKIKLVNFAVNYLGGGFAITKREEINEFIDILRNEILNVTYEQSLYDNSWARISFAKDWTKNNNMKYEDQWMSNGYSFQKDYYQMEEWLTQKGYIQNTRIMPKDVQYMIIEKAVSKSVSNNAMFNKDNPKQIQSVHTDFVDTKSDRIYNKDLIEKCLRAGTYFEYNDKYPNTFYRTFFYTNGNNVIDLMIPKDKAPQFILKMFK